MTLRTHNPFYHRLRASQAGFTLVEIMIGLAIGMLASLIVMQVFSVFEAQKRTTTGAADAQTNGNIALYNIGRDLQLAGWDLMPTALPSINSPLNCSTLTVNGALDTTVPNRIFPFAITDGVASAGVSASDSITIRYGDSPMGGDPLLIANMGPTPDYPTANDAGVKDSFGCVAGDRTLVISPNGAACALSSASSVVAASGVVKAYVRLVDATAAAPNANIACLGVWHEVTYRVNGNNLERQDGVGTAPVPIVAGIVNLQAQYGVSAAGLLNTDPKFNTVIQWVDASGPIWAAPSVADRFRIKAIRIAVIARNAKMDPTAITQVCNTATNTGLCAWPASTSGVAATFDLSNSEPKWAQYRYRVFQTIIPLRNVIWAK